MTSDHDGAPAAGGNAGPAGMEVGEVVAAGLRAGGEMLQSGQVDAALDIFKNLTTTAPGDPEVHNALGVALASKGDKDGAERSFRQATKLAPDNGVFLKNLGAMLFNQQRYGRALKALQKSLDLIPGDVETQYQIALVFGAQSRPADYERALSKVIDLDPRHFGANNDLGCHLITRHRFDQALEHLKIACRAPQAGSSTYVNLANAYVLMGEPETARQTYAKAVDLEPGNASALMSLAVAERNLGELDSALEHIEKAIAATGGNAAQWNVRGTVRRELGSLGPAREDFDAALAADAGFAPAMVNRGLLRLLDDDWDGGFQDLEARWRDPNYASPPRIAGSEPWDGGDLAGKSLLLFSEQGLGDVIQFVRFAPAAADRAAVVAVHVPSALKRLIAASFPDIQVYGDDETVSAHDRHAPLMSLPGLLGLGGPEAVSGAPYLSAPPADGRAAEFLGAGDGLKVGLNWAGARGHREDFKRSVDPALFDNFGTVDGVRFVDLQFDAGEARPKILKGAANLADAADDFADTAAIVGALDLVISVDTATVHLAGALGVPCWALIPAVPDWRWRRDGDGSPWYDSVRLFRQAARGQWSDVLDRAQAALAEFRVAQP